MSEKSDFTRAPKSSRSVNEEFREDFRIHSEHSFFLKDIGPAGATDAPFKNKVQ